MKAIDISSFRKDLLFIAITSLITIALWMIPSGFSSYYSLDLTERTRATIMSVDNSLIKIIGPVTEGTQQVTIKIDTGRFAGNIYESVNQLVGKIEVDKYFSSGDTVFVVLDLTEDTKDVVYANVIDHYRTHLTIWLVVLFFVCLLLVARWIGLKAIVSFIFTGTILFKVLLPGILHGAQPILLAFIIVCILIGVIIFLVGGLCRKGLTAFVGSIGGLFVTITLAYLFTHMFSLHGAVRPFTETLLYTGFAHLNLVDMFIAGIFVASSGAIMDLSMDIAASMSEVYQQNPQISRWNLTKSGITVAQHAVGTMTTTLLLAYSGGYTGMLMTFIARGVPAENVINMVYVSSEIVHTLVGSFGLVLVAPCTALAGGFLLIPKSARCAILSSPTQHTWIQEEEDYETHMGRGL